MKEKKEVEDQPKKQKDISDALQKHAINNMGIYIYNKYNYNNLVLKDH